MRSFIVCAKVPEYEKDGWIYDHIELEVTVDDDRYDDVIKYGWNARKGKNDNTYYIQAWIPFISRTISLHNYLFGIPLPGFVIDHINGNGWECHSDNTRIVTTRQNQQNHSKNANTKMVSKYPGVWYDKTRDNYQSKIVIKGKTKHLGRFKVEKDAFVAYQKACKELGQEVLGYD